MHQIYYSVHKKRKERYETVQEKINERKETTKRKFFKEDLDKRIFGALFLEYLILLIWIIALKYNSEWLPELGEYFRSLPIKERIGNRIVPFYTMIKNGVYFDLDYFCNVIIYIPLGITLPFFIKKKAPLDIAIILLSSIMFETIQLLTGFGGADGTDVACNFLGGLIGLIIYALFRRKIKDKTLNVIAFIIFICFLPITVYAIVNTVINWRLYLIY